jgi:hypothetical protein
MEGLLEFMSCGRKHELFGAFKYWKLIQSLSDNAVAKICKPVLDELFSLT